MEVYFFTKFGIHLYRRTSEIIRNAKCKIPLLSIILSFQAQHKEMALYSIKVSSYCLIIPNKKIQIFISGYQINK